MATRREGIQEREGSPYWYLHTRIKGKLYKKSSGTTKYKEAREIRQEWIVDLKRQLKTPTNTKQKLSCLELFSEYQETVEPNWENTQNPKSTKNDFLRNVQRWIDEIGQETFIHEVNLPGIIKKFINKRRKEGVKPKTINIEIAFLRQAYNDAKLSQKYLLGNEPIWKTFMFKKEKKIDRSMSKNEIVSMYQAAKPHAKNVIFWRLVSGLRKFNSMELTTQMINWDKMTITFIQKGNQEYILPLTHEMENLLKGKKLFPSESDEEHKARIQCLNLDKPGNVFLYNGKPIKSIRRAYKTAQKDAGFIKMYREHDTRHTTANLIGNSEHVMKTYGHSDINTSRIYDQSDLKTRSDSLEKIGKLVYQIVYQNHKEGTDQV